MELKSLKTQDLHTLVQENLKLYIVSSGLKGGDPLPTEKDLAERLNISRTAVREALKGLEALGIIEVRHGVGRFLKSFSLDAILNNMSYSIDMEIEDFKDILEIRVCLESSFIERDIDKFTAEDITELGEILRRMEEQAKEGEDENDLIKTHTEFHLALYRHADNKLLLNLINIFASIQRNLTYIRRYRTEDRSQFVVVHEKLVGALETHNGALAKSLLLEHFEEPLSWSREQARERRKKSS